MDAHKERGMRAAAYFTAGYNCAQAVVLAFGDVTGWDEKSAAALSSAFGGGMGRMREVCGAVSGMLLVLGTVRDAGDPTDRAAKAALYHEVQTLAAAYREKNGSIICRELLAGVPVATGGEPEDRTLAYYKKRPCAEYVAFAAELLSRHLEQQQGT